MLLGLPCSSRALGSAGAGALAWCFATGGVAFAGGAAWGSKDTRLKCWRCSEPQRRGCHAIFRGALAATPRPRRG